MGRAPEGEMLWGRFLLWGIFRKVTLWSWAKRGCGGGSRWSFQLLVNLTCKNGMKQNVTLGNFDVLELLPSNGAVEFIHIFQFIHMDFLYLYHNSALNNLGVIKVRHRAGCFINVIAQSFMGCLYLALLGITASPDEFVSCERGASFHLPEFSCFTHKFSLHYKWESL